MIVTETNTITIELNEADIKDGLIMLLNARGFREVETKDISLDPDEVKARLELIKTTEPKKL